MNELSVVGGEEALYSKVTGILDEARSRVARTVNTAMVEAYWRIGREIVEVEQHGKDRAEYGRRLITRLAARLQQSGARGMSARNLEQMRQFFVAFPQGTRSPDRKTLKSLTNIPQTPSAELPQFTSKALKSQKNIRQTLSAEFHPALSWSHYLLLTRVANEQARAFYEIEAGREAWSVSQLERQIMSKLFERLARQGNAAALAANGQQIAKPEHVLKDPFVLEFLDLEENPATQERDLEQRIIDRIESFMLELGKGFCFVGRQRRITLEGDHFYVDLVFYNRLLRCHVLIDLKIGKLTHQDLGQMTMYANWFDTFQREPSENRTVGIVLCSDKNEAMVRITLPDDPSVLAARYAEFLPSEAELTERIRQDREDFERAMRLATPEKEERAPETRTRPSLATRPRSRRR
ncbi:MAG: PDDEXK nuclease domain-containing protein [Archangium sp.]